MKITLIIPSITAVYFTQTLKNVNINHIMEYKCSNSFSRIYSRCPDSVLVKPQCLRTFGVPIPFLDLGRSLPWTLHGPNRVPEGLPGRIRVYDPCPGRVVCLSCLLPSISRHPWIRTEEGSVTRKGAPTK